jgi:hypothetical protein
MPEVSEDASYPLKACVPLLPLVELNHALVRCKQVFRLKHGQYQHLSFESCFRSYQT